MELKGFFISATLISLFIVCILQFGIFPGENYDKDSSFIDEEKIGFSDLQDRMESVNEDTGRWERLFQSDISFKEKADIILDSVVSITILIVLSMFSLLNVVFQGAENILHLPPLVTGVLISIFIVTFIFSAWKIIKTGESD